MRFLLFLLAPVFCFGEIDLGLFEQKIFSQNREDGITLKIFEYLGEMNKYYVEFDVEDGTKCNTRVLREFFD